ncbi:MAG TPA: hypothetical protein VHM91_01350 [Verrucomicrobiales bacterium]|nr:hypothetical protein [Verrucomicrobiales bacterium]
MSGRILLSLLLSPVAFAQLPAARLDGLFPPGGRVGSEVEISLEGTDLDGVKELLFDHPGFKAAPVEGAKFKVTIAPEVPPGLHTVRASGLYGISTSAVFVAGTLPEVKDGGTNHTRATAATLTLPVTVNGIGDADAADFYRFTAAKDQRIAVDCAAQRIDSPLSAVLSLRNADGQEISPRRTRMDRDAALEFTAPAGGEYTLEIHDMTWRGGGSYHYRLTLSSPQETPSLPPPQPLAGAVSPSPESPVVDEKEPNDTATTPQALTFPSGVSGRLDEDWFSFTVEKSRTVVAEVYSHRLGEPSDPVMVVHKVTRDSKGEEKSSQVSEFDDTAAPPGAERFRAASRDPSGTIACEAGTTYRIMIVDRFNTGARYRLVLREARPDFQLLAMPESPASDAKSVLRWTPLLRRNGSAAITAALLRLDGFDEAVTLKVSGLPAGVTAEETVLPPGISSGAIVLHSAADAKPWAGRIQITGQAGALTHTAREVTPRWSVGDTGADRVDMRLSGDGFVLGVNAVEAAPLAVEAPGPRVYETSLAGTIEIPVKFVRDKSLKGFKGEWEAALFGMPGLRQWKPVKPAGDATEAKLSLSLTKKDGNQFTAGTWNVYAAARGTVRWQPEEKTPVRELKDAAFSAPITVKIAPSPVFLSGPSEVTAARGAKAECALKLDRRYGFAGDVDLTLRAPENAKFLTAAKVSAAKAAEAKAVIECTSGATPGKYACTLEAKCQWNGEELFTRHEVSVVIPP